MNKYEIMFIVKPDVEEEARNTLIENFKSILTVNGCLLYTSLNSKAVKASYKALNKSDSEYFNKSYTENIVGMLDYQLGKQRILKELKLLIIKH